jgi:DNA-binding NarL/FixJ family response regulator
VSGVRELKLQFPDVPLIVLSAAAAQDYEDLSIEAGADAYVQKSAGATEISNVLRVFLSEELDMEPSAPTEKLSKRQKQLLIMLDRGLSNRDIAEELQISEHTVKVHLWRLFRRLNVKSRSQASHLARTLGLLYSGRPAARTVLVRLPAHCAETGSSRRMRRRRRHAATPGPCRTSQCQ